MGIKSQSLSTVSKLSAAKDAWSHSQDIQNDKNLDEKYSDILVTRKGNNVDAYMITEEILGEVFPKKSYRVTRAGIEEVQEVGCILSSEIHFGSGGTLSEEAAKNYTQDCCSAKDIRSVNREPEVPDSVYNSSAPVVSWSSASSTHSSRDIADHSTEDYDDLSPLSDTTNFVEIEGDWHFDLDQADFASNVFLEGNILGKNGDLFLTSSTLEIPVAPTTPKWLSYYGARLLKEGQVFQFGDSDCELPLTLMNVGKTYAEDYLMREDKGGGFYLEKHRRPHFHMPVDETSSGFLVLGKEVEPSIQRRHASTFKEQQPTNTCHHAQKGFGEESCENNSSSTKYGSQNAQCCKIDEDCSFPTSCSFFSAHDADSVTNGVTNPQNKMSKKRIRLSAFAIPRGYAIYTPSNVIHDDGFLVGKYYVVYSKTIEFETVLLKNKLTNCRDTSEPRPDIVRVSVKQRPKENLPP